MKAKTKIILGSAMTAAMCASLIAGSTFALFTSESKTNIAITAGKVAVSATINKDSLKTYSYEETGEGTGAYGPKEQAAGKFIYGTATFQEETGPALTLTNIVPGDRAEFTVDLANESTVSVKYQIMVTVSEDTGLYKALEVEVGGEEFVSSALSPMKLSKWKSLEAKEAIPSLSMSVELPYTYDDKIVDGNEEGSVQNTSCTLTVAVQAVQANAQTTDPVAVDPEAAVIPVYTLEEFEIFRDNVNEGETYADKTVQLFGNFDLTGEKWTPIGTSSAPFMGVFDGQEHMLSNLTVESTGSYAGLFGYIGSFNAEGDDAPTVKNLTVNNATVTGSSWAAAFVGGTDTYSVLENLKLTGHAEITATQFGAGGIVAHAKYVRTMKDLTVQTDETSFVQVTGKSSDGSSNGYQAGGILGWTSEHVAAKTDASYMGLTSNIEVRGGYQIGGIVGHANTGHTWENCKCTGNVKLTYEPGATWQDPNTVGGIAGLAGGSTTLTGCTYAGTISSVYEAQLTFVMYGLVGGSSANATIKSSSAECTVADGLTLHAEWDESGALTAPFSYYIYNAAGLVEWAKTLDPVPNDDVEALGGPVTKAVTKYAELRDSINLQGVKWVAPSGDLSFNGNGHTVSNIVCVPGEKEMYWRAGFLGKFNGEVRDLVLENVTAKGAQAGALMGHTDGCTLYRVTLTGKIDISYAPFSAEAYTESAAAVGLFVGAVGGPMGKSEDLVADCKATLHIDGMENVKTGQTAATRFYSCAVYDIGEDALPAAEEITVTENAEIGIVGADTLVDPEGNVSVFTPEGLASIGEMSAAELNGKTVYIAQNIDFGGEENPWTPISLPWDNSSHYTVDGLGHTLSDLYVKTSGPVGLFASLGHADAPATVQGIVFKDADITTTGKAGAGEAYAGVLCGHAYANIKDITLTGEVHIQGVSFVGGLIGSSEGGKIENCRVQVSEGSYVRAPENMNAGGIVGFVDYAGSNISGCYSNIDVTSYTNAGGIVGKAGGHSDITIEGCTVEADLFTSQANDYCAAGIIGWVADNSLTLKDCKYTGKIYWVSELVSEPNGKNNLLTNTEVAQPLTITGCSVTLLNAAGESAYTNSWD